MSSHRRPKDAWRGGGGGGSGPGRPSSGPRSTSGSSSIGKWVKAGFILGILAGAVAGIILYLWPDPEPLVLALPVTEYKHPDLPPNPWAEADARGFRDRFKGDSAQAFQDQEKARLLRAIDTAVTNAAKNKQALVVYLSALGTVYDGTPYLLPADATPDNPASWITLDDILQPFRRGTTHRMLILDVRPCPAPRANSPAADVSEELEKLLDQKSKAGELPFVVLHAHTPTDGPSITHPFGGSVFGQSLARGVGGAADGFLPDRVKDKAVSAKELAAFAREATHTVSTSFGGSPHVPRIHGTGPDFPLLPLRKDAAPPPGEPPPIPPYPDWLTAAWKDRDAAITSGLHRRAPRLVRQQSLTSSRAEQWWLAGFPPDAVKDRFLPTLEQIKRAKETFVPIVLPTHSLARARQFTPDFEKHETAAATLLRPVFSLLRSPEYAKAEPTKAQEMLKAELGKAKFPPELPPTAIAGAIWKAALETPTVEQVRQLEPIMAGLSLKPLPAELVAFRVIVEAQTDRANRWPKEAVRAILEAFDEGERAVVTDGRAWPLIGAQVKTTDGVRRDALVALAKPDVPDAEMEPAKDRLVELRKNYAAIRKIGVSATTGWRYAEEARAALSDLADHFPHDLPAAAASGECSLKELAEAYRELTRQLHGEPGATVDADRLSRAYRDVEKELDTLLARISPPTRNDPRPLEAALVWTGWPSDTRFKLVDRLRGAVAVNWPESPSGREMATPPSLSAKVLAGSVRDMRNRLEYLALVAPADRVTTLRNGFNDAKRFSSAAVDVRTEQRSGVRKAYDAAPGVKDRERIGWWVDPDDVTAAAATDVANPEWFFHRAEEQAMYRALASGRYQADGVAIEPVTRSAADASRAVAAELANWSSK